MEVCRDIASFGNVIAGFLAAGEYVGPDFARVFGNLLAEIENSVKAVAEDVGAHAFPTEYQVNC